MNIFRLISDLEQVDPEFMDRVNPRRRVFKYLGNAGQKITTAAVPAVVASFFNRAYGQGSSLPTAVVNVLNLALSLEYLEYYYYDTGLNTPGLIDGNNTPAIQIIRSDEAGHIGVLRSALGGQAIPDPGRGAFDYSGGAGLGNGPLRDAFTSQAVYMAGGQAFSDTGQRAYKGGAPLLNTSTTKDILEAALNIHSVEARHNSHFRTVRRGLAANVSGAGAATAVAVAPFDNAPKSWISGRDNGGPTAPNGTKPAAAVYGPGNPPSGTDPLGLYFPADDNTVQSAVDVAAVLGQSPTLVSEAFDEPLDTATVKSIARNFVTAASGLFQ